MKSAILTLLVFFAGPLWAMQVSLSCFGKVYTCSPTPNGVTCQWQVNPTAYQGTVSLVQDMDYPTQSYPYQVYQGQFNASLDGHFLTLSLFYSDADKLHPMRVYANLNAQTVMAESSGIDQIDIALRNQNYGRGFICSNFQLIN